jgi:hypothetical protein
VPANQMLLAPSLRDSLTTLPDSFPTLKRVANKLCAYGAFGGTFPFARGFKMACCAALVKIE